MVVLGCEEWFFLRIRYYVGKGGVFGFIGLKVGCKLVCDEL
jgi:hypothetical protein